MASPRTLMKQLGERARAEPNRMFRVMVGDTSVIRHLYAGPQWNRECGGPVHHLSVRGPDADTEHDPAELLQLAGVPASIEPWELGSSVRHWLWTDSGHPLPPSIAKVVRAALSKSPASVTAAHVH